MNLNRNNIIVAIVVTHAVVLCYSLGYAVGRNIAAVYMGMQ